MKQKILNWKLRLHEILGSSRKFVVRNRNDVYECLWKDITNWPKFSVTFCDNWANLMFVTKQSYAYWSNKYKVVHFIFIIDQFLAFLKIIFSSSFFETWVGQWLQKL